MNAIRILGFFDFWAILKKRKPAKAASRAAAPAVSKTAVMEVEPAPVVAKPPEAKASAAFEHVPATEQPSAPAKVRTLEEVRADVARLRAMSKERHAQVQAKWGANFAPTDFLDVIEPAFPACDKVPAAQTSAAVEAVPAIEQPTAPKDFRTLEEVRADLAYLRATSKERHAQMRAKREINFAPTDFLDFAEASPARDKVEENFAPTAYLDFVSLGAPQKV